MPFNGRHKLLGYHLSVSTSADDSYVYKFIGKSWQHDNLADGIIAKDFGFHHRGNMCSLYIFFTRILIGSTSKRITSDNRQACYLCRGHGI